MLRGVDTRIALHFPFTFHFLPGLGTDYEYQYRQNKELIDTPHVKCVVCLSACTRCVTINGCVSGAPIEVAFLRFTGFSNLDRMYMYIHYNVDLVLIHM